MGVEHLWADDAIVQWLTRNQYHPRSSKHGNYLCERVLADLIFSCKKLREHAAQGKIVYKLNHTVNPNSRLRWTIDLVIGPSHDANPGANANGLPRREDPAEIWLAIDTKSIMTEHAKARRNRLRDLKALDDLLHGSDSKTVVGGLVLINISPTFHSPLRTNGPTKHRNVDRLTRESIEMLETLPRADHESHRPGLEAIGIIVVSHTNKSGDRTRLIGEPPAPSESDLTHYHKFLGDLCRYYTERF